MHFGYPGENTHLEHHGVSEESFWPSFTDIMMVIVMVFLLVTVAVILNNWTLISDLKNSIKAQQMASSLAENTQEQNHTLEEKLTLLEQQVVLLTAKYQTEKTDNLTTQQELAKTQRILIEQEESLIELETTLSTEKSSLETTKTELTQKLELLLLAQAEEESLKQQLTEKEQLVTESIKLKNEQNIAQSKAQEKLSSLQNEYDEVKKSLKNEQLTVKISQVTFKELKESQLDTEKQLKVKSKKLDELEQEKIKLIAVLSKKLAQREKELLSFKNKQDSGESQLRSLQGEYDSLDKKYQKLLQPARSSKGKYVVSVLYRKTGGRRVVRLKSSSNGSYVSVSEAELHKKLRRLKNKYKTALYLKVVIPENSGLSYSDAWKFTSALQKKYDYYFQSSN